MAKTPNRKKADKIVERDGPACWLCGEDVDFEAKPNSERAWSVEHLLARGRRERDLVEHLVLCHPPCNRELRDRPLSEKIAIRDQRQRQQWAAKIASTLLQCEPKDLLGQLGPPGRK